MILGVDLGQRKTGIAISSGHFASPYITITHKSLKEAAEKISQISFKESVTKVIVGYVEGKTKSQFENFAKDLKNKLPDLEVILWDETMTTRQARGTMIKLQIPKTKRKQKEHEVAAALILQSYLDSQ